MSKIIKDILISTLVFIAGCSSTSVDPQPAFKEIQINIQQRRGQFIKWKTTGDENAEIEKSIQKMLEDKLTADRAVQIALLNNPRIQGVYEHLGIAQAQLVQAGLLKNPVFDISLRFTEGPGDDYILEMGAAKDFLDILLVGIRKDRAKAQLEITKSEVTNEVMSLAARTQIAFYSYQASLQVYETDLEIKTASELSYEAAKRLHKAGNITDLALATERSLYEQTKLELASSETLMLQNRETLNTMMGLWGTDTNWEVSSVLPELPGEQMKLTGLESQVIGNSLDLTIARQKMKAVAAQMGIDTAEIVFPEMATGAEAEREDDGAWSVGPLFSIGIPIFDFGQARSAAGKAQLRKLWNNYTAQAIEIRSAARSAKYRLVNARQQADYYRQVIVPLSEQISLETQLQYNAMQLGVFQLLQAKQMQYKFQRNYIKALRNYWIARTELQLLLDGHLVKQTMVNISTGGQMMMDSSGH